MAKNFLHYNILISCPSDIADDKYIVDEAVKTINEENANFNNIQFDVKYWTKNVLYSYGTPQQIINDNIVYDSDIVVALFGTKLGTPTDKYDSGTIEEIEIMIKNKKQVFVCFSEKDITIPSDADEEYLESLIKVKRFKKAYNSLYITYKNNEQLKDRIENQLRLYLNKINKTANKSDIICNIPFSFQELQHDNELIVNSKRIVFCARTGKIFLNGYYNQLKSFIASGGELCFLTSEDLNILYDDDLEHHINSVNTIELLKRLNNVRVGAVCCLKMVKPINISILYIEENDGNEILKIKFNFQTKLHTNHPMFILEKDNPYFDIFQTELKNLINCGLEVCL